MGRGYSRKALRAFVVGWGVAFPPGDGAGLLAESPTGFLGGGRGLIFVSRSTFSPSPFMERGWPTGRGRGRRVALRAFWSGASVQILGM